MKNLIILLIAVLIGLNVSSQEPITYNELISFSRAKVAESFSEGERLSLIAKEIVLAEYDASKPDKILEITCTLKDYKGIEKIYTTVHRDIFKASDDGQKLDNGFFILRDVSLSGIENINVKINIRSLNQKQSNLFNVISNLITTASENNPAINSIRELISTEGELEEEVPFFNSTFYIPNNFINYERIKKESLGLAYLSSIEDNNIAFKATSTNIPKNKLKRFANLILGDKIFTDTENIGGVLVLKATKATPEPLEQPALEKLVDIQKFLRKSQFENIDNLSDMISSAYSTLDIVYPTEISQSTSAYQNAILYLSLVSTYYTYLTSGRGSTNLDNFYSSFYNWIRDKQSYIAAEDYSSIPITGLYKFENDPTNQVRGIDFFVPNNLPNYFLIQMFYMQREMHRNFRGDENIKSITKLYNKKST